MTDKKTNPEQDARGRFVKGNVGGPGRLKGAEIRLKIEQYKAMVDRRMPDILNTIIEKAVGGDMVAARILVDRIGPAQAEAPGHLQAQVDELKELLAAATARKAA